MIHYHGTPLTGGPDAWLSFQGKHAMVSFANPSQMDICAELCQSVVIDNGAFTTWKQGGSYSQEEYAAFVKKWIKHPSVDWYVMPDVIDGSEDDNTRARAEWLKWCDGDMWEMGVPVWHMHESINPCLIQMCRAFRRVAIGSSGQYASVGDSRWWVRMAEAMDAICIDGTPITRLHGLRMLDPTIFSHLPLSSADSTNVARNVGMDVRWTGPFVPKSRKVRAIVMMERIESHASASRWDGSAGVQKNMDLLG